MKKRKFIAAVMALSMIFGQTVYAQEYTVPEETLAESTEAVETKVSEETVENETEKTAETDVESMELETETVTEKTETMTAEYADSVMALNEGGEKMLLKLLRRAVLRKCLLLLRKTENILFIRLGMKTQRQHYMIVIWNI